MSSSSSALEKEADRDRERSAASASDAAVAASPCRYGGLKPCEALAPLLGLWAFLLGGMVGPIQPRAHSWRGTQQREEEDKNRQRRRAQNGWREGGAGKEKNQKERKETRSAYEIQLASHIKLSFLSKAKGWRHTRQEFYHILN